jgi:predicted membrane-bound dolichyl-phosphate-mannose-protein mannosyltransferase
MVTGIASVFLCCLGFVGIVSIILGAVALSQLKQNPQQSGRGFAIAGIVLGALAVLLFVIFLIVTISSPQWMQNFPNALQQ